MGTKQYKKIYLFIIENFWAVNHLYCRASNEPRFQNYAIPKKLRQKYTTEYVYNKQNLMAKKTLKSVTTVVKSNFNYNDKTPRNNPIILSKKKTHCCVNDAWWYNISAVHNRVHCYIIYTFQEQLIFRCTVKNGKNYLKLK